MFETRVPSFLSSAQPPGRLSSLLFQTWQVTLTSAAPGSVYLSTRLVCVCVVCSKYHEAQQLNRQTKETALEAAASLQVCLHWSWWWFAAVVQHSAAPWTARRFRRLVLSLLFHMFLRKEIKDIMAQGKETHLTLSEAFNTKTARPWLLSSTPNAPATRGRSKPCQATMTKSNPRWGLSQQ